MSRRGARYLSWLALALWAAAAFLLVPLAGKISQVESADAAMALPHRAEATQALLREREAFPGTDTPVAVVVYVRDSGITGADESAVAADRTAFAQLSRDGTVDPAVRSDDGKALLLSFPVVVKAGEEAQTVSQIKKLLMDSPVGLDTAVTGSAGALADASEAFGGVETTLLLAAAGVVAVLLLIARYREELHRHPDRYLAMAVAWRQSFPAVLASAATVAVGLLCLLAAQMNEVQGLGPVAATGIMVAFAVVTTLLPALLVLLGRWVFWPFIPRYEAGASAGVVADVVAQHGIWGRLATAIGRRPRTIWMVTTLVLVGLTFGVFGLRLGQPADGMFTKDVGSVVGQRLIAKHYPSGTSYPARIIAAAGSADRVVATAAGVNGVAIARKTDVSADGRWVRIEAVLADPPDSAAAKATVDRLRDAVHAVSGADALVGGQTATTLDISRAASRDDSLVMPMILVVVFGVLVLLLRALVAPLLLVVSVVLSFVAAMGLAGLVLQTVGYPGIDPTLPLWCYLFLVTLGVDYTIFLMTRAREEVANAGNREGILSALTVTGGVITSAGVVLGATFATLVVLPVVMALQIGLIVAIGVLLDTFIVRTLLVPTLAVDLGQRVWWPGRPVRQPAEPRRSRKTVELAA